MKTSVTFSEYLREQPEILEHVQNALNTYGVARKLTNICAENENIEYVSYNTVLKVVNGEPATPETLNAIIKAINELPDTPKYAA